MINSSLPLSPVLGIKPEWIDFNGHLNMAYYMVLFDNALDYHFEQFKMGPDYITRTQNSAFAVEAKITYIKELMIGDEVRADMRVLDLSDKAIHYGSTMFRVCDNALICTMEGLTLHTDMRVRRVSIIPQDIHAHIAGLLAMHKAMPANPYFGKPVGIRRK
jgi:acyl-CoA thioester hydrolase